MRRTFGIALACTLGLICLLPATALAAEYTTYVGCSPTASAAPSHVCQIGDEPGAFFESPEAEVEYEVCVTFPGEVELCAEEQLAEEGILYVNVITSEVPGDHLVTWYVEGIEVGAWTFRMESPPPPPPAPVITTLPPAVTTTPAATPIWPASSPNIESSS